MLSVWCDFKGVVYFVLLPRNQTINSNVYFRQSMKLDKEIKEKRPELATLKGVILMASNWNWCLIRRIVLTFHHPIIYHLFRSVQNHLNGKTFDSNEAVKHELIQFFASKNQTFYESGIMKLTERWQKVIEQNDFVPNNFLLSFKENSGWSASRASKSLRRCCSTWNNVPWLVPSLQRRWFRCWRPSARRKAKNLRRRWCYLLWTVEAERNHHWGTVSNAIDLFEPSTARKTATIRAESRKSDSTARYWQPILVNIFFNAGPVLGRI